MKDDQMDAVFAALSSRARRRMLDILKMEPGCNVNRIAEQFDIGRIAVMKHLGVLEAANLVVSEKVGRERRMWFNVVPVQLIHDRWTSEFSRYWAAGLANLKHRVEQASVPRHRKTGGARG